MSTLPTYKSEHFEQMKRVQGDVVRVLLPFREKTESALIVFALARIARTLLRLYPDDTRQVLTRAVIAFLEGRTTSPDDPEAGLLAN